MITSVFGHVKRQKLFREDGDPRCFFTRCNLCLADDMDQFQKALMFTKDQGLMTDLSCRVPMTHGVAATSAPSSLALTIFVASIIV